MTTGDCLLTMMLRAPLIGVRAESGPTVVPGAPLVLHAVTMEQVCRGFDAGSFVAACGADGLLALGSDGFAYEWPPRLAGLPAEWSRCRACHEATGRKRPRSTFQVREAA